MVLPPDPDEYQQQILDTVHDHNLELIGQYYQWFERDLTEHVRNYETYLRHLAGFDPQFINCQTGKDYFSFEQNRYLFELAVRISAETGVRITHETHRGKTLFAAHVAQDYHTRLPDLADLS